MQNHKYIDIKETKQIIKTERDWTAKYPKYYYTIQCNRCQHKFITTNRRYLRGKCKYCKEYLVGLEKDGSKILSEFEDDLVIRKTKYNCKCHCGKDFILSKLQLKSIINHRKKLQCKNCHYYDKSLYIEEELKEKQLKAYLLEYKHGAIRRGLDFKLSDEEFKVLVYKNCYYCNQSPKLSKRYNRRYLVVSGIDRIDSTKGYSIDNCTPCCSTCNKMKMVLSHDNFIKQCKKITENLCSRQTNN